VGVATWGYRVIETVGKHITELTPSRGFAAEFAAACTILLGSRLGMPISTTHTLVGSVIGVALARGMSALNFTIVKQIVMSWVLTLPFTGVLAALFFIILRAVA